MGHFGDDDVRANDKQARDLDISHDSCVVLRVSTDRLDGHDLKDRHASNVGQVAHERHGAIAKENTQQGNHARRDVRHSVGPC